MKIKQFLKRYGTFLNIMLLFLAAVVCYFLVAALSSLDDSDFLVSVVEKSTAIGKQNVNGALSDREVHSVLHVKASGAMDYLLLEKLVGCNIFQLLLALLVLFQIFRINANWYRKRFSKELYTMIDGLSIMAIIMWIFARIQEKYQDHLLTQIADNQLVLANDRLFFYVGLALFIMASTLKSFAKQGSRLQEEQELTI